MTSVCYKTFYRKKCQRLPRFNVVPTSRDFAKTAQQVQHAKCFFYKTFFRQICQRLPRSQRPFARNDIFFILNSSFLILNYLVWDWVFEVCEVESAEAEDAGVAGAAGDVVIFIAGPGEVEGGFEFE